MSASRHKEVPPFLATPARRRALGFLRAAYDGPRRRDRDGIRHALAVAELVECCDPSDTAVIAALLHDVVEDTETTVADVGARFGHGVARLVAALTEDGEVADLQLRKALLRARVVRAGRRAAFIAVADKLATLRAAQVGDRRPDALLIGHYRATIDGLERAHGQLPYAAAVRRALAYEP